MKTKMNTMIKLLPAAFVLLTGLMGCGSDSTTPLAAPPAAARDTYVTGVAATGAAMSGASITLKDASTTTQSFTQNALANGSYSFSTKGLPEPYLLQAQSGVGAFYSMSASVEGIANINPLTTVIVSVAAGGKDLATLFGSPTSDGLKAIAAKLADAESRVKTALAPIFAKYNLTGMGSIINSKFVADQTGLDAVFDVIGISVDKNGNITITDKVAKKTIGTGKAAIIATGNPISIITPGVVLPELIVVDPGITLYNNTCRGSGCHTTLAAPDMYLKGKKANNGAAMTVTTITDAMANPINGVMYNNAGLQALVGGNTFGLIVDAINKAGTGGGGGVITPPTPAQLYTISCASCHGAIDSLTGGTSNGVAVKPITAGISLRKFDIAAIAFTDMATVKTKMSATPADVTDLNSIITYVNTAKPFTGAANSKSYNENCSVCHGSVPNGTGQAGASPFVYQKTQAQFDAAVKANQNGLMQPVSALVNGSATVTNGPVVTAILAYMNPLLTPVVITNDGVTLYNQNCVSCHGALPVAPGTSTAGVTGQGPALTNISLVAYTSAFNAAVSAANLAAPKGAMAKFTNLATVPLTQVQLDAILAALPVKAALTGLDIYTSKCSTCHGAIGATTKIAPATADPIGPGMTQNRFDFASQYYQPMITAFASGVPSTADITLMINDVLPKYTGTPGVGVAHYDTYCAGCHAPLGKPTVGAATNKGTATAAQIEQAITHGWKDTRGNMASLRPFVGAGTVAAPGVIVKDISTALNAPGVSAPVCGSCHSVTLSRLGGQHPTHANDAIFQNSNSCSICHGASYSTTSNGHVITHYDGTNTVAAQSINAGNGNNGPIVWNAKTKTCESSTCHQNQGQPQPAKW